MSSTSGTGKRGSFFGSLKQLARTSSHKMGKPADVSSNLAASKTNNINNNNTTTTNTARHRGSPFGNPSPATRRPPPPDAPPPPYTADVGPGASALRNPSPAPSALSTISIGSHALTTEEDPYAFLSTFDTIFLIDDSGSMAGTSWRETRDVLQNIAPVCAAHDADGIDVYFLNTRKQVAGTGNKPGGFLNIKKAEEVSSLFETVRPYGSTPTGTRLQAILNPYIKNFEQAMATHGGDAEATGIKPVNLIIITDGVPTDDPESVLLNFAKRLDKIDAPPYQLGVQFFQVGKEPGAREALMELDDNLGREAGEGVRDIVDTTTWDGKAGTRPSLTADGILKAVLGAVVKRLDRRRISVEQGRRDRLRP